MTRAPFVGRSRQLAHLRAQLDETADTGTGRFVLVQGEAGAGKTRLCSEFVRLLGRPGQVVAWSRCWVEGGGPPLWPWPDLVAELATQVGTAVQLVPPTGGGDRFGLFQTVVEQLRALTSARPVIAIIDDLHAAEDDAVLLTRFVARALHRFPLLLLATWRTDRTTRAVPGLSTLAAEADVLDLAPFNADDIAAYLRHRAPTADVDQAEVQHLLECTGGNPLYLAELVRQPDDSATDGLALVLARRVAELAPGQRDVLGAAALLGPRATIARVAEVVGQPPSVAVDAIATPGSGAVVEDGEVRFSHELVRAAIATALPAARRHELHLAARAAIHGGDPDRVVRRAHHAIEAARLTPADASMAVADCIAAAVTLRRALAFEQAAEWASRACELAASGTDRLAETEARLTWADCVLACGRLAEANELYAAAVAPAESAGDPRLLARAALGLGGVWVEEQRDELARRRMLGLCRRAAAALPEDEPVLAARLAVRLAAEQSYDGDAVDVEACVDEVRRLGDPAATAEALSLYHHTLLVPERCADRLRVAEELLDVATSGEARSYSLLGLCWRTVDLYLAGDRRAERSFIDLRERAAALGSQAVGYIVAVLDVMRTFRRGDLAEAEALAEQALTIGAVAGDADALAYYGGHIMAIRFAQGRLDELLEPVQSVIESSTLRRCDHIYPALLAYAMAVRGDHTTARTHLDRVLADGLDALPSFSTWSGTMAVLVETAVELGDAALADALGERFRPVAHLPVMPSLAVACLGPGQRVLGRALATAGRLDEAIASYDAAVEANRRLGNRPFGAIIDAERAELLQRRDAPGDASASAALWHDAIATGRALGMDRRVDRWTQRAEPSARTTDRAAWHGTIERTDGTWRVEVDGRQVVVDNVVGMRYVAELLARPDTDITACDLSAIVTGGGPVGGTFEPTHDRRTREELRRRLEVLDRELERADATGNVERSRRAADERAQLIEFLRRDTGLGGRARRTPDEAERSRMRVSKAIRRAVDRVRSADPVIGRTLDSRIHTGLVCRYDSDPGQPIEWTVHTSSR